MLKGLRREKIYNHKSVNIRCLPSSINNMTKIDKYWAPRVAELIFTGTFSGLRLVPPSRALIKASAIQLTLNAAMPHANMEGAEQKGETKNKECVDSVSLMGSPLYSLISLDFGSFSSSKLSFVPSLSAAAASGTGSPPLKDFECDAFEKLHCDSALSIDDE